MKNKKMSSLVDILKESKGDIAKESIELNIEDFKLALSQVDSQMKNLPATAQVSFNLILGYSIGLQNLCPLNASIFVCLLLLYAILQVAAQQGAYLASCFNRMEECEKNPEGPVRFRGSGRHRFKPFRYLSYFYQ